jgi:predicted nucleotidyltransferase
MISKNRIQELALRIALEFQPERIILFGSYARGDATPDSDVDLLVVLPHKGKGWRRAAEIRSRLRPDFPLDLLVRTPEEISKRLAEGDPFIGELAEKGEILYERDHAAMG